MVSAILLAAGSSSRMGDQDKLSLIYKDRPLIIHMVLSLLRSNIEELVIVKISQNVAFQKQILELISTELSNDTIVKFAENSNASKGMTSSIQAGINLTHPNTKGFMICQCDMPLITEKDYNQIIQAFKKSLSDLDQKTIAVPYYNNKKGNPAIFSHHYKPEILSYSKPEGLRSLIQNQIPAQNRVTPVPMPNANTLMDIDTPEDWNKLTPYQAI